MTAEDRFDVELVAELLRRSLHNEDDVIIDDYLQSYEEINKFFSLMGSVFGFVSSDVRAKIGILSDFLQDEQNNKHFYSIKTMLAYEKESGLFNDLNYVSGSRTLLRLHRGLEFVYEFLRLLYDLDDNAKTHMICKKAYNETLAKHHPFLIRKGALVAMYTLPSKTELLKKVCTSVPSALQFLPDMLKQLRNVYDRTQYLYTIFDCLGLP